MTRAVPGRGRRWGAVMLLRVAGAILRGTTALHHRRAISAAQLRAALAAAQLFERAGAGVALGKKSRREPIRIDKDEDQ